MRTVLIADRSLTIRRVVEHALGGRAARVVGAADADELFRLARVEAPDILLCDATLPGLVLEEMREALARVPELADKPLVLLTSALEPLDSDEAARLGASGLLVKPFEIASLADTIERALERGVPPTERPSLPETPDEAPEPAAEEARIPEPPSFDSVWDESAPAEEPDPSGSGFDDAPPADQEPFALPDEQPGFVAEEDEPLGPLSIGAPAFDAEAERVPLPGDEDFRLGVSGLTPGEGPVEASTGEIDSMASMEEMERIEPGLRVLIERVVREVAWEVIPDIVERIVRERDSSVLPDSSSGDRKP